MAEKRLTFKKGDAFKYLDENSKLIPIITKDGWELQKDKEPEKVKVEKK